MTIVFVSSLNDRQLSIRSDFDNSLEDLGIAAVGKGIDGWSSEMNRLLDVVRGSLNSARLGGSLRDMSTHLMLSHYDKPFSIHSYDAGTPPGKTAETRPILDQSLLPPQFLVQSALYDIACGEEPSSVARSLRSRVAASVEVAVSRFSEPEKAVTSLIGNAALPLGNSAYLHVFAPLYKDGPVFSQEFLDDFPEHCVGVFAELVKKAYPDIDISLELDEMDGHLVTTL